MAYKSYAQIMAVQAKYRKEIKEVNPRIDDGPGIYFLLRTDENGIKYFYIGQALKLLTRMCSHMTGYQHIDLSIKKRGWYSADNPYGWTLNFKHYAPKDLDRMEQYWILQYTKAGYQARYNKTSGGQGEGKEKINEFKPSRGYRDGLKRGYINASRDIAHLFEKHLDYKPKNYPPNRYQKQAMEKFEEFLNVYKEEHSELPKDNGAINTVEEEVKKYGRTVMPGNS